jgi:gliding motility-associated-like protein
LLFFEYIAQCYIFTLIVIQTKTLILTGGILLGIISQGQNLVPNCSFSSYESCPTDHSQFDLASYWFNPGDATTDLCHECCGNNASLPGNLWGIQEAYTGNGYGHIICYYPMQGIDYREYMEVELPCQLIANETYKVSFYASCTDNSRYAIDRLALVLTESKLIQYGQGLIDPGVAPATELSKGSILTDKTGWTKIESDYTATGNEKFLTIGCFTRDDELSVHTFSGSGRIASYYIDNVSVTPRNFTLSLGPDTTLCAGSELFLDATIPCGVQYNWNDGYASPARIITEPGYYSVDVTVGCGSVSDALNITFLPELKSQLPSDTIICTGADIILDAGSGFADDFWQDGSSGQVFTAGSPGMYWVEVTDSHSCTVRDSVLVSGHSEPEIFLGNDTVICFGDSIKFDLSGIDPYAIYRWNDAIYGDRYSIGESGEYWVLASNPCGMDQDTIVVESRSCEPVLHIPNAFSPNNDGRNDQFNIRSFNIDEFKLVILDRWGQLLFETNDTGSGWDGMCNGNLCPEGIYVYIIRYTSTALETRVSEVITGNVMLLRN